MRLDLEAAAVQAQGRGVGNAVDPGRSRRGETPRGRQRRRGVAKLPGDRRGCALCRGDARRGRASAARTRAGEGVRVLDRLEGDALRVRVGPDGARQRVGHRHHDVDVGQTSREDPEPTVEGPTVHDLDHHLDIVGGEEPEVPRVGGQRHRHAGAARALGRDPPVDPDLKATTIEAESAGVSGASGAWPLSHSTPDHVAPALTLSLRGGAHRVRETSSPIQPIRCR